MMAQLRMSTAEGDVVMPLGASFSIGRLAENSLSLPEDRLVSRRHATIDRTAEGDVLRDLDSQNGTFLERGNRKLKVDGQITLSAGDVIQIGGTRLTYEAVEEARPSFDSSTTIVPGKTVVGRVLPAPIEAPEGSSEEADQDT